MTFLTYAQNFEDVLLWRALGHVTPGFYIDIGANDPDNHSVTKAFYERGWRGINVEPLPHFHQRFLQQRPRDINLSVAAGAAEGELTLYDVPSVDGWASADSATAAMHKAEGHEIAELTVPVRTLAGLCSEYADGEIHFLKVDVEGFEAEVLQGMDFARWQPWIVVVEATLPNSRVTNHEKWEPLLTAHGYRYAYFDGLNRYYVAPGHPELTDALQIPPNVFDDFRSIHLQRSWDAQEQAARHARDLTNQLRAMHANLDKTREQAAQAQRQALELEQHLRAAQAHAKAAHERALDLDRQIVLIHQSLSWRVTRPLRWAKRKLAALRGSAEAPAQIVQAETVVTQEQAAVTKISQLPRGVEHALRDLQAARAHTPAPAGAKPRMAYISPLPPEKSGIADYSAQLLPELARHYDIEVVTDQQEIADAWVATHLTVRSSSWFGEHAAVYDRIVYHFGNSPLHKHMFGLLQRHPGIVVLHDFYLGNIIDHIDRSGYQAGALTEALLSSHGYPALIEWQREGRVPTLWKYPCNRDVIAGATGVIVHSE
ncbi:MAG TPA: FkbM family methyltransferase, partial [Burkholderiaceae bacterium]